MSEDAAKSTLLGPGTWTRQGPATLLVRENAWIVLVPGLRKQVTEAAWEVLGRRPAPEDLVDQLVEAGELGSADNLTALLFGVHDGERATLGVKGSTPLAVYSADGARLIVGTEEEPMALAPVEKVRRVAFGDLPPEEPVGAPRVVSGIVPVRGFVHMCVDPDQLEEEERKALVEQVEKDGRSIETEEAKQRRAERPAPKPAPKPASTPSRSSPSSSSARTSSSSARRTGQTSASSRQAPPEEPSGPNLFAGLFGDAPEAPSSPAGAAPSALAGAAPAPGDAAATAAASSTPSAEAAAPSTAAPSEKVQSEQTPSGPADSTSSTEAPASAEPTAPAEPSASAEPGEPASAEPSASAEPGAPARAEAPTAAAAPAPSAAPAEGSSEPTDSVTSGPDGGAPPSDPSSAAPTQNAAGMAPQHAAPAKRRLVSTSLFDRKRAAADTSSPGEPATPSAPAAPSEPAAQTTAADESAAAASPAPPAPEASPAPSTPRPAAATSPAPPTPAPADEVDALQSPPTLVAPIDDGESSERDISPAPDVPASPAAPAGAAASSAGRATPVAQPAPTAPAAPAPEPAAAQHAPAAPSGDLENSGAYDDLFGKTVFRRIEDAAVRHSGEDEEAEHEETAAPVPDATDVEDVPEETRIPHAASADEVEETPVPEHTAGDFIDWVPGVGRTAPEIAQAAARRAAHPRTAPPAYPQVHMAERPPAPVTGSRPTPSRPDDLRGAAGGDRRADGSPYSDQTPYGSESPHASESPYGSGSPHRAPSPYGRPGQDPRSAAPAAQARHASPPHPVAPQPGAVPPSTPPQSAPRPGTPQQHGAPQQAASPQNGPGAAGTQRSTARPSGGAVALPGLVCRNGHANPPDRTDCRICAGPLDGPTRTVARPPLGAIAVSTGERYVLDRSTIVGRRPRASRVSVHDVPQLVTVPSPQQDISRSHLELRLEGWHVVALDLATTNGTTLHRAGHEPLRLRAREGVLLRDGDLLDLGDDVHLTYGEKS